MTLTPRTRLGPYEIIAPLGAGGMGEVYTARDTRLARTVALKTLASQRPGVDECERRHNRRADGCRSRRREELNSRVPAT